MKEKINEWVDERKIEMMDLTKSGAVHSEMLVIVDEILICRHRM